MEEINASQSSPNFQDRLHYLLLEAEQFVPGSTERTNSLEQIRSILMDRGSSMRQRDVVATPSHHGRNSHASRSYHGGAIISPSDDGHILDEYYLGHETAGALHSIPEASDPSSDRLWDATHSMAHFAVSQPSRGNPSFVLSFIIVFDMTRESENITLHTCKKGSKNGKIPI